MQCSRAEAVVIWHEACKNSSQLFLPELSKLPLMVLSNGISVSLAWTAPWLRSSFFLSVCVHFWSDSSSFICSGPSFSHRFCFIHAWAAQTACTSLGKLPVPGGTCQCRRWVIHHDQNVLWRQVRSPGDLPEKLGNWLHVRLLNHCQLVSWVDEKSCGGLGLSGGDV